MIVLFAWNELFSLFANRTVRSKRTVRPVWWSDLTNRTGWFARQSRMVISYNLYAENIIKKRNNFERSLTLPHKLWQQFVFPRNLYFDHNFYFLGPQFWSWSSRLWAPSEISKLFRESYSVFSFFDIASPDGGRGLWSLISGDDVITGSCPNKKNWMIFGVFEATESNSELCFRSRFTTWTRIVHFRPPSSISLLDRQPSYMIAQFHSCWPSGWILDDRLLWFMTS